MIAFFYLVNSLLHFNNSNSFTFPSLKCNYIFDMKEKLQKP